MRSGEDGRGGFEDPPLIDILLIKKIGKSLGMV